VLEVSTEQEEEEEEEQDLDNSVGSGSDNKELLWQMRARLDAVMCEQEKRNGWIERDRLTGNIFSCLRVH